MKWSLTITGDESEISELEQFLKMLRESSAMQQLEGKYSPLQDFLNGKKGEGETHLALSMEDIQAIIHDELPPSARKHDSFWRDRRQNIGAHIVRAGWHVHAIERNSENDHIEAIKLHVGRRRCRKSKQRRCAEDDE